MAKNFENFVFFDSSSLAQESSILYNPVGGTEMTVQVSGLGVGDTCSLKFVGKADADAGFEDITIVDMDALDTVDTITKNGIYILPLSGIVQIKGICTSGVGTIKVFGILVG